MIFFEKYLELSSSNLHAYILYIFFLYLHIYFFTDSFSLFFLCTLYIYKHVGLLLVMDQFAGTTHLECGVYCRKKMSLK